MAIAMAMGDGIEHHDSGIRIGQGDYDKAEKKHHLVTPCFKASIIDQRPSISSLFELLHAWIHETPNPVV